MAESNFRSNLFRKNKKACFKHLISDLAGKKLISVIHDLLCISVSIDLIGATVHPVCVANSIKNFISDNKKYPSKKLLKFLIEYLFEFDFRLDDKNLLNESVKNGIVKTAFVSDIENACQNNEWNKAEALLTQTFIASDHSRGTFDTLAELALQDSPKNALFVYHILRAYQFQENNNDNWIFVRCIFKQISNYKLKPPHDQKDIDPSIILDRVVESGDILLYSSLKRIWEADYVRSRGYNREISYWLSKITFDKPQIVNKSFYQKDLNRYSFISLAENIIEKGNSKDQISMGLVTLEALRSMMKNSNEKQKRSLIARHSNLFL